MIELSVMEKIRPGATVRITERVPAEVATGKKEKGKDKEGEKKMARTSTFTGIVLARKHGSEPGASITLRATIAGVGVEKVFPIHSPMIAKAEIIGTPKRVRRAKLYYLRTRSRSEIRQRTTASATTEKAAPAAPAEASAS